MPAANSLVVTNTLAPPTPEGTWLEQEAAYMKQAAQAAAGLYEAAVICQPQQVTNNLATDAVSQALTTLFQGVTPLGPNYGRLSGDADKMVAVARRINALADSNASQIAALQATIRNQAATISNLQTALANAGNVGGGTPQPPAQPPATGMSTMTLLFGLLGVATIVGGAWWVSKNAKTKAHEAMEAGYYTPPAKQLGAGESSTKAELVSSRRPTQYKRRRTMRRVR